MRLRAASRLLLLTVAACAGASGVTSPADRARAVAEGRLPTCPTTAPGARTIILAGTDPTIRAALAERLQGEVIATVALTPSACDIAIELLACSRRAAFRRGRPRQDDADWLPPAQLLHQAFAAAGTLTVQNEGRPLRFDARYAERREVSWYDELTRAPRPARWGTFRESFAPALERVDLSGPDCGRATHWIRGVTTGSDAVTFARADGNAEARPAHASRCQPPTCAEPVDIAVEPIRPLGCPPGTSAQLTGCEPILPGARAFRPMEVRDLAPGSCPAAVAGQLTERAAQAKRLFDSERWSLAYGELASVARGETGDDLGNRQLAGWLSAITADRLGDRARAASLMTAIAAQPCHSKHDEAAFYAMVVERRGPS